MLQAYFLTGCTASGKSAIAHEIALRWGADILSADSMQVYRGMDVGTAKPSLKERSEVRYSGIDLVMPGAPCNLSVFYDAAYQAATAAASRKRRLIVVGGTGLYLRTLLCGIQRRPPQNPALRAELNVLVRTQGVAVLAERLRAQAPERYARLNASDRQNPRRLTRALEIAMDSSAHNEHDVASNIAPPPIPGLRLPSAQLHTAITARARQMFQTGLLEETRALMAAGLTDAPTAIQAIGYAETAAYMRGEIDLATAEAITITRTKRLAKKQNTWFRNKMKIDWLDVELTTPLEQRAHIVMTYWEKHGPCKIFQPN